MCFAVNLKLKICSEVSKVSSPFRSLYQFYLHHCPPRSIVQPSGPSPKDEGPPRTQRDHWFWISCNVLRVQTPPQWPWPVAPQCSAWGPLQGRVPHRYEHQNWISILDTWWVSSGLRSFLALWENKGNKGHCQVWQMVALKATRMMSPGLHISVNISTYLCWQTPSSWWHRWEDQSEAAVHPPHSYWRQCGGKVPWWPLTSASWNKDIKSAWERFKHTGTDTHTLCICIAQVLH